MEFRPLETIGAPDSPEEETRATIGEHSMDAVRLTEHLGTTMLADDLGLRRFIQKGGSGQTMSTVSLLPVLAERGVISSEERDRLLLRLVERRYVAITPTPSLLLAALHPGQPSIPLTRQAFALLGGPTLDLAAAATVVAEALREMSIAPLQVAALTRIVTLALDGLSGRWPAKLCAHSLARSAAARLSLMPGQLKEVQAAIAAYVKRTAS
jgi:hypothetical protein